MYESIKRREIIKSYLTKNYFRENETFIFGLKTEIQRTVKSKLPKNENTNK